MIISKSQKPYYYAEFLDGTQFSLDNEEEFSNHIYKLINQGQKIIENQRIIELGYNHETKELTSLITDYIRNNVYFEVFNTDSNEKKKHSAIIN